MMDPNPPDLESNLTLRIFLGSDCLPESTFLPVVMVQVCATHDSRCWTAGHLPGAFVPLRHTLSLSSLGLLLRYLRPWNIPIIMTLSFVQVKSAGSSDGKARQVRTRRKESWFQVNV